MSAPDRYDLDILAVCLALHTSHTGSAEPLPGEEEARYVAWLRQRLAEWQTPHPRTQRFDDAVKALVEATLAESGVTPAAEVDECKAHHPEGWICTEATGHAGEHVASTYGDMVCARWI